MAHYSLDVYKGVRWPLQVQDDHPQFAELCQGEKQLLDQQVRVVIRSFSAGYRVLFRSAVMLATDLEVAYKELRLPRLLAQYRRFDLVLVDEVGYLPFAKQTAELLFQFFSDRYERASVAITSNLAFAQWTQVFGTEQMTVALLDRLVHRSHVLVMEGESFRFRQSLQKQDSPS